LEDPLDLHAMLRCLVPVVSRTATDVAANTKYLYQLMHDATTRLSLHFNALQLLQTAAHVTQTLLNNLYLSGYYKKWQNPHCNEIPITGLCGATVKLLLIN